MRGAKVRRIGNGFAPSDEGSALASLASPQLQLVLRRLH